MRHRKSAFLLLCFFMIFCFVTVCPALATDRAIAVMKETPSPYAPESEAAHKAGSFPKAKYVEPMVAKYYYVEPMVEKYIVGYVETDEKCQVVSTGYWNVKTAPSHGTLRFSIDDLTITDGTCAGIVLPVNAAYYTWTDTASDATQDSFSLRWFTADGILVESDWIAYKQTAVFMEHGVNYGWDDFTDPKYPSKSVGKGHRDTVLAKISPVELYSSCRFMSLIEAHLKVSPSIANSASQIVTLKGIDKGSSVVWAQNNKSNADISKVNIFVPIYKNLKLTVSVTLVHKKGTGPGDPGYHSKNIPDAAIIRALKKVYKQAVIQWEVTRLPAKTVAFDLNKDGKLDIDTAWMNSEMQIIRDACKSNHDYNIFMVSHPSISGVCGFMLHNQKYGFILTDCGNANTVAHELGHGQGLSHTPNDDENIMYNYIKASRWRLRLNQWNQLNP